ncbi:hypothetical protein CAS79_08460, partial [Acinetobacter pittii]
LRFQRKSITFDAAPESELLVLRDRIAVADYRNGIHQSGDVVQQEGLILTLSHDVDFIAGKSYVIYLQMGDGSVDLIPVTAGSAKNKMILGRLPNGALKLSSDDFVNTIYTVVNDDTKDSLPYLVAKKDPVDKFSNTITAVNYDVRYYLNDKDFIDVPVDDSPIYIRYDQLDINLARLYQMQRGDLPTTGEISFIVEAGALVSSSSSLRPETRMVYKFDYDRQNLEFIVPAAPELPAIDTGEFPSGLTVNLTIKGSVVGRGGDGGLPHLAYAGLSNDPDYNFAKARRDGFQGAPGLMNRHSKLNLIIDGGTLARGGSGGGATPSGIYTGLNYGVQGVPGGAGAPFGRVMTGQPIYNDTQDWRWYLEGGYLLVVKVTDAEAEIPGKGYRTPNDGRYVSPLSGDGGGWGQRGTKSTNDGTWNWQYHGTTEGQPGAGGTAIVGVAPLTTQLINGGKILQTL